VTGYNTSHGMAIVPAEEKEDKACAYHLYPCAVMGPYPAHTHAVCAAKPQTYNGSCR
jgi:hypothetical protein